MRSEPPHLLPANFFFFFFMAVLGLHFCARAFSSCCKRGPLFIAVCGPLTITASLVAEHRLQMHRLSNCGSRAQLLRGMWDLPRPGLEPVFPALAGRFSTTAPPGKPPANFILTKLREKASKAFKCHRKLLSYCSAASLAVISHLFQKITVNQLVEKHLNLIKLLRGLLQDGRGIRRGDHLPHHKYIKTTSTCGTSPTEHLLKAGRRPQTSQKMPSGDLHAEAEPNAKLNPRSCANKEEKGKSLPAASGAAD